MARSVLVLDDDDEVRRLVGATLAERGCRVVEAGTGDRATRLVERERFDLIVVDDLLPDTEGARWVERLRCRDRAVTVVLMVALWRRTSALQRLTRELGVSFVVSKPINADELADQVEALLAASPPVDSDADASAAVDELAALQREYRQSLPSRVEHLCDVVRQARTRREPLDEAIALAHRLRGTAGSYGFLAVSEAAGRLEEILVEGGKDPAQPGEGVRDEIERVLEEVRLAGTTAAPRLISGVSSPIEPAQRLLVVDDDPKFLSLLAGFARRQMVELVPASSTAEAVDKARSVKVAAALLDVWLGPENTFDLARELRALDGYETLPLGFVSIDPAMTNRVAAAHAGASLFLEKPLSQETFDTAVERLLQTTVPHRDRVVLVEDDPEFTRQVALILGREGILLHTLPDAVELLRVLDENRPDLLMLDIALPEISGFDACRAVRTSRQWHALPILILTARTDPETRLESFRAGATDYVPKPVLAEELIARVRVRLEQTRLLRERTERDGLSGLLLRRPFLEALEQRISEAKRFARPVTLAMVDLDHFKLVNDTYGHLSGDEVITALGRLLRQRFRAEDVRARWGGEEFALVFPGQEPSVMVGALERVLEEFSAMAFRAESGQTFRVTFTAGLSSFPDDGSSGRMLVRSADERLYAGKRHGRGRIVAAVASERQPPN